MTQKDAGELSILVAAQRFVDDWRRSPGRGQFNRAVTNAANLCWTGPAVPVAERIAFIRVAHAIRIGRGHVETNPDPLLAILRDELLREGKSVGDAIQTAFYPQPRKPGTDPD